MILNIHSYGSLITNSSSEIFCIADENTLRNIKELVSGLITMTCDFHGGGDTPTAEDLFDFELIWSNELEWKEQASYWDLSEEEIETGSGSCEYPKQYSVKVTPKDTSSTAAQKVASTLSNLTSLFDIYEYSSG
jgi:hypothetical protein